MRSTRCKTEIISYGDELQGREREWKEHFRVLLRFGRNWTHDWISRLLVKSSDAVITLVSNNLMKDRDISREMQLVWRDIN